MFARRVSMHLKPNTASEFAQTLESQVLPLLRKQAGFVDELTFTSKDGKKAFGLSLWEHAANAEAYDKTTYPEVVKLLEKVIQGSPQVDTYNVANSTCHKILATATR